MFEYEKNPQLLFTPPKNITRKSSAIYSIEEDLIAIDEQLRHDLELHFRPVFQQFVYGGERIASHDLRRLLQNEYYKTMLPPDKVFELNDLVDFNPGKAISYTEFVRIVTGGFHSSTDQLSLNSDVLNTETKKTWLNAVCRNTVPQAEVDEHLSKYKWMPPPFFMIAISLAQLAVFIYYAVDIARQGVSVGALDIVPAYSPVMYLQTKRQEAWRFVSYMFVHQGGVDLAFNLLLQICIGFPLEVIFSWWRIAIVYLSGVITGSLAQSVCDHNVDLAGAAGGAYAVIFAHIVGIISNWSEINNKHKPEKRTKHFYASALFRVVVILLVVAVQSALAIYRRFNPGFPQYKVGVAAYGGGIVAGLLLGTAFMTDNLRYPWKEYTGWFGIFTLIAFFGGCVIFNIVYSGYPEPIY